MMQACQSARCAVALRHKSGTMELELELELWLSEAEAEGELESVDHFDISHG